MQMKRSIIALLGLVAVIAINPKRTNAQEFFSSAIRHCLAPAFSPLTEKEVWVTAYSSTPDQTDDDPFITASQKRVRPGIVATNILPFGTKVRIPKIFGDRIFIVEDRMHERKKNDLDIWMPSRKQALAFGRKKLLIEVVEYPV